MAYRSFADLQHHSGIHAGVPVEELESSRRSGFSETGLEISQDDTVAVSRNHDSISIEWDSVNPSALDGMSDAMSSIDAALDAADGGDGGDGDGGDGGD